MGGHDEAADARIVGQGHGQCGRLVALLADAVEDLADGVQVGRVALQGLAKGGLDGGSAMGIEEAHEARDGAAEAAPALGDTVQQVLALGDSVEEAVGCPGTRCGPLAGHQLGHVAGVFDLLAAIPGPGVGSDQVVAIEEAHAVLGGQHKELAAHLGVGHRVVVAVETDVGGLAHRQNDDPVVLYVDASRARRDGCRFERNAQGLWQCTSVPVRHVLNLREGFAEQVSAGGIPIFDGPRGPELALIQVQRRSGVTWEVAKGKLEAGESPVAAAVREVQEEMGKEMELEPFEDLGFVRYGFQTPDGSPRLKTLHMYLMRAPKRYEGFSPSTREGILAVRWFTLDDAVAAVTHRSLRPLMRTVQELLDG